MPMKAAMYLRKSRAEEHESAGAALARHREALARHARENGIVVEAVYEEVVSGDSLFARPEMLRLLEDADRYDAVLCMDIDRLGRGAMREQGIILETLKAADVRIVTPGKTYDLSDELDETYGEFRAFMARQELKLIKGRMRRGRIKSAEEGCHLGPPPYGYRRAVAGRRPTLAAVPEEAETVRAIFALYTGGLGPSAIAARLTASGVPTRSGQPWHRATLRRILRNDVYIGRIAYAAPGHPPVRAAGLHEAIVAPEVFDAAQRLMRERRHPPAAAGTTLRNPFAGVLFCAVCGRAMELRGVKGRDYLVCRTKGCTRLSALETVEAQFWAELERLRAIPPPPEPESPQDDPLRPGLQAERARLLTQRDTLHDLLERGVYTQETFQERTARLAERLWRVEAALEEKPPPEPPSDKPPDPARRNRLIRSLVRRVRYERPSAAPPRLWIELR